MIDAFRVITTITVIAPFKVIQVSHFNTNRKLACDFILVNDTNVSDIWHSVHVIAADYWSNFRCGQGEGQPLFNTFVSAESLNSIKWNLATSK